ncbi:hypothetical protein G7K_2837-t1 [Saitoella complicata NRRL Y-17804]|uniref:Fatty acid hydroxylase domain-containing protein n=1 Tax=Saitoella complicata (strain BCRC 22490 / CBS 7301 / JCM 7358 / NBRC 10748 / NRRL Y-17804) TaxID=698492 RepID=A0A0E9NFM4_SAICN|nr:hypothetical protein G7K_2837-t1 [Saitoella complicata NRRL Y-17804]
MSKYTHRIPHDSGMRESPEGSREARYGLGFGGYLNRKRRRIHLSITQIIPTIVVRSSLSTNKQSITVFLSVHDYLDLWGLDILRVCFPLLLLHIRPRHAQTPQIPQKPCLARNLPPPQNLLRRLFTFINIWTILIHDGEFIANNPLINGTACHTIHHLYFNRNYGQFTTLWDGLGEPEQELFEKEKKKSVETWKKEVKEMEKVQMEVEGDADDCQYLSEAQAKNTTGSNLLRLGLRSFDNRQFGSSTTSSNQQLRHTPAVHLFRSSWQFGRSFTNRHSIQFPPRLSPAFSIVRQSSIVNTLLLRYKEKENPTHSIPIPQTQTLWHLYLSQNNSFDSSLFRPLSSNTHTHTIEARRQSLFFSYAYSVNDFLHKRQLDTNVWTIWFQINFFSRFSLRSLPSFSSPHPSTPSSASSSLGALLHPLHPFYQLMHNSIQVP